MNDSFPSCIPHIAGLLLCSILCLAWVLTAKARSCADVLQSATLIPYIQHISYNIIACIMWTKFWDKKARKWAKLCRILFVTILQHRIVCLSWIQSSGNPTLPKCWVLTLQTCPLKEEKNTVQDTSSPSYLTDCWCSLSNHLLIMLQKGIHHGLLTTRRFLEHVCIKIGEQHRAWEYQWVPHVQVATCTQYTHVCFNETIK